ncbi:MAG TPA: hypothetical protein VIQ31_10020 [Phormidium sp.]
MEAANFEFELDKQPVVVADIVAEDVKGNIVLLVEIIAILMMVRYSSNNERTSCEYLF